MEEKEVRYSFSKLSTYDDCQMSYYLKYVLESDDNDNIYSLAGTSAHNILEAIQKGEITNEEGEKRFLDDVTIHNFMGFGFPSEKISSTYTPSIANAIRNYTPYTQKCEIEKKVLFNLDGITLTGFIDLIVHNDDGTVDIIDYKTSSKYSGKDLVKKANQLLLYAIALEDLGYKVNKIGWMMLKYARVKGVRGMKTVMRNEVKDGEYNEPYMVYYDYNPYTRQDCIDWIKSTVKEIESKDMFDYWEAKKITPHTSFTCTHICGVKGFCGAYKEFCNNNRD